MHQYWVKILDNHLINSFKKSLVVGYGLARTLSADLTLEALLDAISKRNTEDLIHHSDQGIQYCSSDYVEVLKEHGIEISMPGKANLYDNARIESFFRTLKVEEVYNKKRLHSSLGYLPPGRI